MTHRVARPNVIVPGAQKCGTSSLVYYLSLHPECFLSTPKEPSFFSRSENLQDFASYGQFFAHWSNESIVLEASTGYLFEPYAAARIRRHLGRPRVIIILRNPLDRMFSAYLHLKKRLDEFRAVDDVFGGFPDSPESAILLEERRLIEAIRGGMVSYSRYFDRYDDFLWPFRYFRNSWYIDPVNQYIETFGRENVYVMFLEDLDRDPRRTMSAVFQFLGVEPFWEVSFKERKNRTTLPRVVDVHRRTPRSKFRRFIELLRLRAPGRRAVSDVRARPSPKDTMWRTAERGLRQQFEQLSVITGADVAAVWDGRHELRA